MSRLNDLLYQLRAKEPNLARDLEQEFAALADRRSFGLNFERHVPEAVELPGRKVRKGDKVRVVAPRGEAAKKSSGTLWRVLDINRSAGTVSLELLGTTALVDDEAAPERSAAAVEDAVVVAEFRDPLYRRFGSDGGIASTM